MTKRTLDLEVGLDGRATWPEGTLEPTSDLASALEGLPPLALVQVVGDYRRVDACTRVLAVRTPPVVIATAVERAIRAWEDQELVARLEPVLPDTGNVLAVLSYRALVHDDVELAGERFVAALRAGVTPEVASPLARVWERVQHTCALERDVQARLAEHAWTSLAVSPWAWKDWLDPVVGTAWAATDLAYPCHFGGKRPRSAYRSAAPWLELQCERLAEGGEVAELRELRAMPPSGRRVWLRKAIAHDTRAVADAVRRAQARAHDDDWIAVENAQPDEDSLEREKPSALWAELQAAIDGDARGSLAAVAGGLAHLARRRRGDSAARAFALALDAVMLLAEHAPELTATEVEDVVLVDVSAAVSIVRLRGDDRFALLHAPEGAFGPWRVVTGTHAEIARAVPQACRAEGEAAMTAARGTPARGIRLKPRPVAPRVVPAPTPPAPLTTTGERHVVHPSFGRGRVVEAIRAGSDVKLVIEFETAGRKVLLERFVKDA